MIDPETRAQIRRYFYAEHWKIGTIARELGVHPDAVRNAIEAQRLGLGGQPVRASIVDPYLAFLRETLDQHPRLRATRIYQMARDRGYTGSVGQLRRAVARLRPQIREPFLRLETFAGEQAQVDWAHFGHVMVGRARRALSCFVMTLSYSRALYLEFFFDQTMENFLRGHVRAFQVWGGQPRTILYDNLKSAVVERRGFQVQFHPRLLELSGHYHFAPQACQVRADEQPRLLPPPLHPFNTDRIEAVCSRKTIYLRFDLNDYSIPPEAVGHTLTLVASDTSVRILDGAVELARHPRSYDRQQQVLDPEHRDAVLKLKRRAFHATPAGRLEQAVPESKTLLDLAFTQGESAGSQTAQLLKLLEEYGAAALRRAVLEALERHTPRASSVAFLLRRQPRPRRVAVDLSGHPEAQSIDIRPHSLETYDELAHPEDDDSDQ